MSSVEDSINRLKELEKKYRGNTEVMHYLCDKLILDLIDPKVKNEYRRIHDNNGFRFA